jgi:hypothetical protein
VEAHDRVAFPFVQIVEPQAVDLLVVRGKLESGQPLEPLVGCPEGLLAGRSLSKFGFAIRRLTGTFIAVTPATWSPKAEHCHA